MASPSKTNSNLTSMRKNKTMKRMIQPLLLGLTALLLVNTPPPSPAAPRKTGIEGQAFLIISYGTPTEIAPGVWVGIPSVQLGVATSITVFSSQTQHEVDRITTDADGNFAVALHPGKYLLVPETLTMPFGCAVSLNPIEVTVPSRGFTTCNLFYFREGPCGFVGTVP